MLKAESVADAHAVAMQVCAFHMYAERTRADLLQLLEHCSFGDCQLRINYVAAHAVTSSVDVRSLACSLHRRCQQVTSRGWQLQS